MKDKERLLFDEECSQTDMKSVVYTAMTLFGGLLLLIAVIVAVAV